MILLIVIIMLVNLQEDDYIYIEGDKIIKKYEK